RLRRLPADRGTAQARRLRNLAGALELFGRAGRRQNPGGAGETAERSAPRPRITTIQATEGIDATAAMPFGMRMRGKRMSRTGDAGMASPHIQRTCERYAKEGQGHTQQKTHAGR